MCTSEKVDELNFIPIEASTISFMTFLSNVPIITCIAKGGETCF